MYPDPFVYAPVTGFYSLSYSSAGLERAEDTILNGSDQRLFGRRLADFFTGRDPRGGNVDTTIVPRVQQAGWDAMQQGCNGPCKGAVVAIEPSTGRILAMVSSPSYDPNLLATHDLTSAVGGLAAAPRRRQLAADQPRHLGALSARFDVQGDHHRRRPAGGADRGRATHRAAGRSRCRTAPTPWRTTAERRAGRVRPRRCAMRSPGPATPRSSSWVCDVGADALRNAATSFGLDSPPDPIPLQVSESTVGPIADRAALAMSSIGQKDVSVTPLQNALVAATIANQGVMMQPFLVSSLKAPDLANIATNVPSQQRRAVSPQVAAKLRDLMVGAEQYTQQKGAIPGVQIASKTGTAEHGTDPRNTPPHAWYIAFAPAQAPKVAVAVLVENGGDRLSATGGAVAAPIGRAVIAAALQGGS